MLTLVMIRLMRNAVCCLHYILSQVCINLYDNRLETSQFDCSSRGIPSLIFGVGAIFVYSYSQIIKTIDNSKEINNAKHKFINIALHQFLSWHCVHQLSEFL